MRIRDITALTIKVVGIFLFVLVVSRLPESLMAYLTVQAETEESLIGRFLVLLLAPVIFAVTLIIFPHKIDDAVIFRAGQDTNIDLSNIELIAIRMLGLFLLCSALFDLAIAVSTYILLSYIDQLSMASQYNYPHFAATAVELLFALWLLAGKKSMFVFLRLVSRS